MFQIAYLPHPFLMQYSRALSLPQSLLECVYIMTGTEPTKESKAMLLSESNQLWKNRASPVPMLCPLAGFIVYLSPHLLMTFSSLALSSPHITYLNSVHLKLTLLRPMKRSWTLTFWATLIQTPKLTTVSSFVHHLWMMYSLTTDLLTTFSLFFKNIYITSLLLLLF